jgi:hypothetical protein
LYRTEDDQTPLFSFVTITPKRIIAEKDIAA